MKKCYKKTRGFTLIEVIVSIIIFTMVVVGFYSAMFGVYKNTSEERVVTEEMYEGQSDIEKITSSVRTSKETIKSISNKIRIGEKTLKDADSILTNQDTVLNDLYGDVNSFIKKFEDLKIDEINEADIETLKNKIENIKQDVENVSETPDNKFVKQKFIDTLTLLIDDFDALLELNKDVKDFLSDAGCSLLPTELSVFESTVYKADVRGYQIAKPMLAVNTEKFMSFVSFEDTNAKQIPEFNGNPYIINYSVKDNKLLSKNELKKFDYTELEFIYANPDYIDARLDDIRDVYKENVHIGINGKYLFDDKSKKYSYYEIYDWYKSKKEYEVDVTNGGTTTTEIKRSEPVFRSQNENKIPDEALDNFYPISNVAFEKIPNSGILLNPDYLQNDVGEGYVKLKVTPVSAIGKKTNAKETNLLWIIGLPVTNNLYYHYDASMEGSYLPEYDGVGAPPYTEVDYLRDLTTVYTISDKDDVTDNIKKMKKDSGKIKLYKDKDYGKYIELSNDSDEAIKLKGFRQIKDKPEQFKNKVTIILVLDLDNAQSGTILKKSNVKFSGRNYQCYQLDYDKSKGELVFWSGADSKKKYNSVRKKVNGAGKHVVILTAKNVIYPKNGRLNSIAVDSLDFNEEFHDKYKWPHNRKKEIDLNMWGSAKDSVVLEIGGDDVSKGAKGTKLYELIAYTDVLHLRDDSAADPLYYKELPYVLDYLKEKYQIN